MKNLLYLIIVTSAPSCKSAEPLQIRKEGFTGNEIKIDGYFYSKVQPVSSILYFYHDGVCRYVGLSLDGKSVLEFDDQIRKAGVWEKKKIQYTWGIFKVQGSVIKVNRWVHGSGGEYPAQMMIGEIKNDSTIWFHTQIGDNTVGKRKKAFEIDETFRFRQFAPKPDSANPYIR